MRVNPRWGICLTVMAIFVVLLTAGVLWAPLPAIALTIAVNTELGAADQFVLLALNAGTMTINSATSITGNVGYSAHVFSHTNQKVDTFTGEVFVHSTADFQSTAATFQPSLGFAPIGAATDAFLDQANSDAAAAATFFAGLGPSTSLGNVTGSLNLTAAGDVNVFNASSWNFNNAQLTLTGDANDLFLFIVTGSFDWSHAQTILNGVSVGQVVFLFPNASQININKADNIFDGIILAPTGSVDYHNPATFTGAIIADNIVVHSDFNIASSIPPPVPEPSTLLLLVVGLVGLAWAAHRTFSAVHPPRTSPRAFFATLDTERTPMKPSGEPRLLWLGLGALVLVLSSTTPVAAIPALQLYIEGATYDSTTETWDFTGDNFRLWVMGDVGHVGPISAVKLTAAFADGLSGSIVLTPALASPSFLPGLNPDPSLPPSPSVVTTPSSALTASGACGTNGSVDTIPCMGNGSSLPQHGEYGAGIQWNELLLGDFTLTDSPIGDFTTAVPNPLDPTQFPDQGQINAYDVAVSGFPSSTQIHFDAFDHIFQSNGHLKFVFAPFSHDALDSPGVPEPSTLILLGAGVLLLCVTAGVRNDAKRVRGRRSNSK